MKDFSPLFFVTQRFTVIVIKIEFHGKLITIVFFTFLGIRAKIQYWVWIKLIVYIIKSNRQPRRRGYARKPKNSLFGFPSVLIFLFSFIIIKSFIFLLMTGIYACQGVYFLSALCTSCFFFLNHRASLLRVSRPQYIVVVKPEPVYRSHFC